MMRFGLARQIVAEADQAFVAVRPNLRRSLQNTGSEGGEECGWSQDLDSLVLAECKEMGVAGRDRGSPASVSRTTRMAATA